MEKRLLADANIDFQVLKPLHMFPKHRKHTMCFGEKRVCVCEFHRFRSSKKHRRTRTMVIFSIFTVDLTVVIHNNINIGRSN